MSRYDANEADAALIAAAPDLLTSLCDAMESAERRAEEAEAQAAALRAVLETVEGVDGVAYCVGCSTEWGDDDSNGMDYETARPVSKRPHRDGCRVSAALATDAGRALLDRLQAAEARVAEVEAAQKMRAESADPDDETWRTREEYLRRVKAEARVADLENVRVEQAAKLRRHLDEIAELSALHGVAEARERRLERDLLAIWATVRPGNPAPLTEGDVLHAVEDVRRERDALRSELAQETALRVELTAEVKRLKAFEAAELQRRAIIDAMNGGDL